MEYFCETNGVERKKVRFMFEGKEVFEADTPNSIGMKLGDTIDACHRLNYLVIGMH